MQKNLVPGVSRSFRRTLELASDYAQSSWPVLIHGETGVGKDLLAQFIHQQSELRGRAFVAVNCGALPATLFESELFGYERGAFSGAVQSYKGVIRAAHQGSLFLDEIGELEMPLQAKLLRWLDSGEVRAIGSSRTETVQARILAATHVDLVAAVRDQRFRLDLLERLGVLTLHVPALRERREDIPYLAAHWLNHLRCKFEPHDFDLLCSGEWPGNVRQLRNVLVRACARGRGILQRTVLQQVLEEEQAMSEVLRKGPKGDSLGISLAEIERRAILDRIRHCQGNKKQAARELGIAKSTLHDKIRRWKQGAEVLDSSSGNSADSAECGT